jgi:hypothetical protein
VIAWYCNKGEVTDAEKAKVNVGVQCLGAGYNECYNTLALKQVNKSRNNHDVAPLKLNKKAAREIDYHLSA